MYLPCRALFERLVQIVRDDQAGADCAAADRVLDVLVQCNKRGDCPERVSCRTDIDNTYTAIGLAPPFGDKAAPDDAPNEA
jgi:hypothetical protein